MKIWLVFILSSKRQVLMKFGIYCFDIIWNGRLKFQGQLKQLNKLRLRSF